MQRIKVGMNIWNDQLRRDARKQRLSICPQVTRDSCALPDCGILEQPKHQHGEHLHIIRECQLRTSTRTTGGHGFLVRFHDVNKLVRYGISSVFEFVRNRAFNGPLAEESSKGNLINGGIDLRDAVGCRISRGDNANPTFA